MAVVRRAFLAINAYIKKVDRFQINNLIVPLKEQEKQKQTKSKIIGDKKNKDQSKKK